MVDYRTLEGTEIEVIHESFVSAFSDYSVKIDMPLSKFQNMLKRRGFVPKISMGAFKDGKLIGFILNCLRDWDGVPTAYDNGTGVIPEYRKQGITKNLFNRLLDVLKDKNISRYLLEVIQSNTPAFNLYKSQGFEITRSFICYRVERDKINLPENCSIEVIEDVRELDWELLSSFWDSNPSWQNSVDSILAVHETFLAVIARADNNITGYGIVEKNTGDIPQLAVDKKYRQKGIAKSIVSGLAQSVNTKGLGVINVDEHCDSLCVFLAKCGLCEYVRQYEMIFNI